MSESGTTSDQARNLGLLDATRIGVGAIVGGGILALAGTAYAYTGPAAVLAFAINGLLAVLTAMSFAEMASAFPDSGGAYAFARRVLSVRAAFAAGWVLWAAYIVAGVMYALGFGVYGATAAADLWQLAAGQAPAWLRGHGAAVAGAVVGIGVYSLSLIRRAAGGGELSTYGKVVVLTVLVLAAAWCYGMSPSGTAQRTLLPFMPAGVTGLLAAMGFTFIALQGFDLIATVAGEVKNPSRTIPRAMFMSLGIALLIYLPLLILIAMVGGTGDEDIMTMAKRSPDTLMATAVGNFLGPTGYWLVMLAAILSMASALHANLLAASRVARTMANDRTLPWVLGGLHRTRGTPTTAIYASALSMVALLFMLPDLAAAGATASLIFLLSFALAHYTAYLARRRMPGSSDATSDAAGAGYRSPLFPLVPVGGGLACLLLAVWQALVEPSAGAIAFVWLGLGGLLYVGLFSERAEAVDAASEASDATLASLRGRSPLVLVPVGNPDSAAAMVQVASALSPPRVGKVLLLSVLRPDSADTDEALDSTQAVFRRGMRSALAIEHVPEVMITVASDPWAEIERVAEERRCARVLIGLSDLERAGAYENIERLMGRLSCDVSVLRAPTDWHLETVRNILVPVGGRGSHEELRARLLGRLGRTEGRAIKHLRVVAQGTPDGELASLQRELARQAAEVVGVPHAAEVVRSDDTLETIAAAAASADLVVLGLQRRNGQNVFGSFALELARKTESAIIMVGGRSQAPLV
ncbi:MAG: amino acid permease, partial [Myxococcales bacterium]|nr:amino acid permease [Myxococcales bacterium]